MQAFVYKSLRKADTYVYLAARDDFTRLPEPLRTQLGDLSFVWKWRSPPNASWPAKTPGWCAATSPRADSISSSRRSRTATNPPMPEPASQQRRLAAIAGLLGVALAALGWVGGPLAAFGAWLAQPALALAWSWQRGSRPLPVARDWRESLPALLIAWGGAFVTVAVLIAWPLSALGDSGSLQAALGLSAVVGVLLIGLWRTWPLWQGIEREPGSLGWHWRALAERDFHAWRGLGVAALVALVIAGGLVLAWPDLLPAQTRLIVAPIYVLALPALHWGIQSIAAARGLPVVEMSAGLPPMQESATAPAPVHEADLEQALFDAARGGRVDRALELLEAGADPHALPAPSSRDQRVVPVLAAVLPDLRLLRTLIGHGVDLNHAHAGMTPLLAATRDSWHGRPDAVTTLLANGADPRVTDSEGKQPLHHAARYVPIPAWSRCCAMPPPRSTPSTRMA